ncbi:MAG: ParA family protein [Anaerolineae bacterium]|nr:ParA family protein [Anaerolineae bacterium]NUQ06374.1 ParA family protein [Anaerolineae bacterium]
MKTIMFCNEKGGVGKTTLAIHTSAGLALRENRVLLVDADPQAHSTHQLQIKEQPGLYDMLVRDADARDVIRVPERDAWAGDIEVGDGQLLLLPGNVETRSIMSSMSDDVEYLRESLEELRGYVDYVVIDTSPTPSLLHAMIYIASDYVIFPTQAEMLSMDGLAKTQLRVHGQNRQRVGQGMEPLRLLGVQPTMVTETRAHKYGKSVMEEHLGDLIWPGIPMATIWRDAGFARQTLYAYSPEHSATYHCWGLIDRVLASMKTGRQHDAAA